MFAIVLLDFIVLNFCAQVNLNSTDDNVTEMQWRLFEKMVATSWDDNPILVRDHQRSE